MTSATRAKVVAGAAESTLAAQQVEALKERLRLIGQRLCEIEGLCDTAPSTVYSKLDLGTPPPYRNFQGTVALTVEGEAVEYPYSYDAYSEQGARLRALRKLGFLKDEFAPAPVVEPGTETDEFKELAERTRELARKHTSTISKPALNKYLRWAGIEPLPERKRFTFAQPSFAILSYKVDADSEEQARTDLAAMIERDRNRVPGASSYGTRTFYPTDEAATVHSTEVIG